MAWLKHIATLVFCVSIAFAGFPAQAKSECPEAAKMQMQQMDMKGMKDCKDCDKMAKQEPQKQKGCCGDMTCVARCASMSNANPAFFGTQAASFSPASDTEHFYDSGPVLASAFLQTQERPPKSLA